MNLCYYCRHGIDNGRGCVHPSISGFIGNRFPLGIRLHYCGVFMLREDKVADVKLKVGSSKIPVFYNIKSKNYGKKTK